MYAEINAAIQSAKTAFDLIKATKELSNSTEVLTAVNDVQRKLSSAIAAALASQEKQALQRWLRFFGQNLSLLTWCLAVNAYAAVGRAGRLSQYTRSGVHPSSARCGLISL